MVMKVLLHAAMRINLSASEVATSRHDLTVAKTDMQAAEIEGLMNLHDFDVIPIANNPSYPLIRFWHRSNRSCKPKIRVLAARDMVLDSMSAEYALERILEEEDRSYLFTRNQMKVTGIITLSDFNSMPFRIHVYAVVATTEELLARLVNHEKELKDIVLEKLGPTARSMAEKDWSNGMNYPPSHYLNLSQILNVISRSEGMLERLGFSSRKEFAKYNSVNLLRNAAAHASKTLIHSRIDAQKVLERLQKLEDLSFRVRAATLPLAASEYGEGDDGCELM